MTGDSRTSPTISESFAFCDRLARAHYENFPVGSRLLPAVIRPHVCAIYAFARTADDFADEPGLAPEERLRRLGEWEERLNSCTVAPEGPIFTALAETLRVHELPSQLLLDLLTAYRLDVTQNRHPDFDAILTYCRYSANPVGRMVLWLFGHRSEELGKLSDHICTGLQLTNFWQDIGIDASRDRVYLPEEDLSTYGVSVDDLKQERMTEPFRKLVQHQVERTRVEFELGRPLLSRVGGRLALELRATWLGGSAILTEIERAGCDVFNNRPVLGFVDMVRILTRALFRI